MFHLLIFRQHLLTSHISTHQPFNATLPCTCHSSSCHKFKPSAVATSSTEAAPCTSCLLAMMRYLIGSSLYLAVVTTFVNSSLTSGNRYPTRTKFPFPHFSHLHHHHIHPSNCQDIDASRILLTRLSETRPVHLLQITLRFVLFWNVIL